MTKNFLAWLPTTVIAGFIALYTGMRPTLVSEEMAVESSDVARVSLADDDGGAIEFTSENQVIMRNTAFVPAGFVILKDEVGGNPGSIIGQSALVGKGQKYVPINLTRSVRVSEVLYVNYYVDDGDGVFSMANDLLKDNLNENTNFIKLVVKPTYETEDMVPML